MREGEIRYRQAGGFVHRRVAEHDVLISVGANVANFNGYITLNPAASFLWDALAQPQSADSLTALLTEEFDVTPEKAREDVTLFLDALLRESMVTVHEET
jgi:hypothetical protein